jgi:hypothetical protein
MVEEFPDGKNTFIPKLDPESPSETTAASLIEPVNETPEQNSDHSNRQNEPDDILGNKSILKQVYKNNQSFLIYSNSYRSRQSLQVSLILVQFVMHWQLFLMNYF